MHSFLKIFSLLLLQQLLLIVQKLLAAFGFLRPVKVTLKNFYQNGALDHSRTRCQKGGKVMKRLSIVVLMMAMVAMFATPSSAMLRKDLANIKGKVTYVNAARNEVTVKDYASGKDVTFTATKGVDVGIGPGTEVTVIYKKGTTTATSVRQVAKPSAGGGMAQPAAATPAAPAKKAASWY